MTGHAFPETFRTLRRLILLRHARAKSAVLGGDDFARPLTAGGRVDAALIGRVLAADGVIPDRVLLSSAQRTAETWSEVQAAFPTVEGDARRELYLADARTLLRAIDGEDDAEVVMVIGHNPGMHSLAVHLLRQGSASPSIIAKFDRGFPTATAAVFAIDLAGRASYDGLYLVSEHGGGGSE